MELRTVPRSRWGCCRTRIDRVRDLCARWVQDGHTPALVGVRRAARCHRAARGVRPAPARGGRAAARDDVALSDCVGHQADYRDAGHAARRRGAARAQPAGAGLHPRGPQRRRECDARPPSAHPHVGVRLVRRGADALAHGAPRGRRLHAAAVRTDATSPRERPSAVVHRRAARPPTGRVDDVLEPQLRAAGRDRPPRVRPADLGARPGAHLRSARDGRQLLRGAGVGVVSCGAAPARGPDGRTAESVHAGLWLAAMAGDALRRRRVSSRRRATWPCSGRCF